MNRIYRLVFNRCLGRYQVASELARTRGKSRGQSHGRSPRQSRVRGIVRSGTFNLRQLVTAGLLSLLLPTSALADAGSLASNLPSQATISHGRADISVSGADMHIQQHSHQLITNWQNFSIGENNSVTFSQPGSDAVALNRVLGQDPSQLLGSLNANGQVFLLNPNGVVIGQNASVQTGAFVASTLGLRDEDFLTGHYQFNGDSNAAILNRGDLQGAVVALISAKVSNEGSIVGAAADATAPGVALAAGTDVLLDFDGDGLLSVEVKASTLQTLVQNQGLIQADGGLAILTAKGASDALKGVVNNSGTVQAQTLAKQNGRILLLGDMEHGEVNVAGTLDASAPNGGDGGFIDTSAAQVAIANEVQVTTRAAQGETGTWLIDPTDFTVSSGNAAQTDSGIGADTLESNLETTSVMLQTVNEGTEAGNINVNDALTWSSGNTLILDAHNNIAINAPITATAGGLTLNAGNNISASAAVDVGIFNLISGRWEQHGTNLPAFEAKDFRINPANATFLRVLDGDGTENAPYLISDIYGLQGIGSHSLLGYDFVLANDIDASDTANWNSGAGFDPLGRESNSFTGTFDGLDHTIHDLTINRPSEDDVGLFGRTDNATLRNVELVEGSVSGHTHVGGLVGWQWDGSIEHAYATGSVEGTGSYVGGLVGGQYGGSIKNVYATGRVEGIYVGGLVGYQSGDNSIIAHAYATGRVEGTYAGGLVGSQWYGSIVHAYATGNVEGTGSYVGGLVGWQWDGSIAHAYATGNVSGALFVVGGLVGFQGGDSSIAHAYATGSVSGASRVGGLVGYRNDGNITHSFYATTDGVNSAINNGGVNSGVYTGNEYGSAKTLAELQQLATFADWDNEISAEGGIESVWRIYEGHTTPLLRSFLTPLELLPDYDGSSAALDNIARISVPTDIDSSLIGNWNNSVQGDTLTLTGNAGGGGYTASSHGSGIDDLYSFQNGYDIITSRNISTPGSAAGEVRLPEAITWNSGHLRIDTDAAVTTLGASNGANTTAIDGDVFTLARGNWAQNSETLADFSVKDFRFDPANATFLRVLGGDGSEGNAYRIGDIYGLQGIGSHDLLASHSELVNDIDASATASWNLGDHDADSATPDEAMGFDPLGEYPASNSFTGTFDGQGHSIDGLVINRPNENDVGLFGRIGDNATLRNVGLSGGSVSGRGYVGGLVGWQEGGGSITHAYATSSVSGNYYVGGLVGVQDGASIAHAYATGRVEGATDYVGGLVGRQWSGSIEHAYATGSVSGNEYVGGLVGRQFGDISQSFYATTDGEGNAINAGDDAGTAKSLEELQQLATFEEWGDEISAEGGIESVWRIYEGHTTPLLRSFLTPLDVETEDATVTYNGTFQGGSSDTWSVDTDYDPTLILGTATATGGGTNAGSHAIGVEGLYSSQQGYDINYVDGSLTITPATLTLNAVTDHKTYDGTTDSSVSPTVTGLMNGDSLSGLSQSFDSKNVLGTDGSTLNVNEGYALDDGNDGNNYLVVLNTATGTITPATLTIDGLSAEDRVYDGSTDVVLSGGTLTGVFGSDDVTLALGSGSFADKHVGTDKIITVSDSGLNGADASNYELTEASGLSADITPATLTLNAVSDNKTYDGTTDSSADVSVTGLMGGDSLSDLNQSFDSKNVLGTDGSTLSVNTDYVLDDGNDGNDGNNYLVVLNTANGTIKPATLTLTASSDSKMYDSTTESDGRVRVDGLLGDDSVDQLSQSFDSAETGERLLVVDGSYVLDDGNGGDNYEVVLIAASGNISAVPVPDPDPEPVPDPEPDPTPDPEPDPEPVITLQDGGSLFRMAERPCLDNVCATEPAAVPEDLLEVE